MKAVIRYCQLVLVLILSMAAPAAQGIVITRTSVTNFYTDISGSPSRRCNYVSYTINNNDGASYSQVWATVGSFSGGVVGLAPTEDGVVNIGSLANGETKAVFFYLCANSATATDQSHTITVFNGPPSFGLPLGSGSFTLFNVEDTIQANANKVNTVVAGPTPPELGGLVTITVDGDSGTIGAENIMAFSAAVVNTWPANAYELYASSITLSGGSSGTFSNILWIPPAVLGGSAHYTATFFLRAVGTTAAPTTVSPTAYISSGANTKHTGTDPASLPPIDPTDNHLFMGKTVSAASLNATGLVTFTLTLTNLGARSVFIDTIVDTMPALPTNASYVAGSSTFNGAAIPNPNKVGQVLTWPGTFTVPAASTRTLTFQSAFPNYFGTYTNRAVATVGPSQIDTTQSTADNAPATAFVTVNGPAISGSVYLDANHNLQKDSGETGTGIANLYAKLVPSSTPTGPAIQIALVDPATGFYSITNVYIGNYNVVIDTGNTLSDVTPTLPAGWSGTEMPSQIRSNLSITTVGIPNQNFGLVNALTLTGRVFKDTGQPSGTANDGILNGAEAGIGNVVVKLTDTTGATTYDTATTDGAGNYALLVPTTLSNGVPLKIIEVNSSGYLSSGASVGTSGGTYTRTNDTILFTFASGTAYTGVNFGDVPVNTFVPDGQQAGLPGTFVLHPHTFIAGSGGQVTFLVASAPAPAIPGWSQVVYRDANGNGILDPGESPASGAIPVVAGDKICVLVKDFIPAAAPMNAQDALTVTAAFNYSGASPALATNLVRTDLTTVGNPSTSGLTLLKAVDKQSALPGETITYTITYGNNSDVPLANVIIYDATPAFTTFLSATNGPFPTNFTAVSINAPTVGGIGSVQWTFTGSLGPGRNGTVQYSVNVAQ